MKSMQENHILTPQERAEYLKKLQTDAQRVCSILMERLGNDPISLSILEDLYPWLFGRYCIILPIQKAIDNGARPEDIFHFASIARRCAPLQAVAVASGREDPDMKQIFSMVSA